MKIKGIYSIVVASVMTCRLVVMRRRPFQQSEIYEEGIMFYNRFYQDMTASRSREFSTQTESKCREIILKHLIYDLFIYFQ
jgi:hypothetical protein